MITDVAPPLVIIITLADGSDGESTILDHYASDDIPYNNDVDEQSHTFNLGDQITVTTTCNQNYSGSYVFEPTGSTAVPTAISEAVSVTWEQSDVVDTSSTVGNSDLNNTNMEDIENRLDDRDLDINTLIDDIIGKK